MAEHKYSNVIQHVAGIFGFNNQLKEEQIKCLQAVLDRRDTMAFLPTGFGKSLIYQMAPFALSEHYKKDIDKSICLILTPLNSIMMDQIHAMQKTGVSACALDYHCTSAQTFNSGYDSDDYSDEDSENTMISTVPVSDISSGKYTLVYAHPEALLRTKNGEALIDKLAKDDIVSCIAIDEAHIILEWGKAFRKDFSNIGDNLLARFPEVPAMVFTATASPDAQKQIEKNLRLKDPYILSVNPDRPNIKYSKVMRPPSINTDDHLEEILQPMADDLVRDTTDYPLTLFYTDTSVISFAYAFFEKKMGCQQYVGEPVPENRLFAQYHQTYTEKMKKFIIQDLCKQSGKIRIVFATIALGMGLNAPHVRQVIHYKPPTSLEKYFQETGRAGRDGQQSSAVLYYNNTDIRRNRPGIEQDIINYCKNDKKCLRSVMLECFKYKPSDCIPTGKCCCVCDTYLQ